MPSAITNLLEPDTIVLRAAASRGFLVFEESGLFQQAVNQNSPNWGDNRTPQRSNKNNRKRGRNSGATSQSVPADQTPADQTRQFIVSLRWFRLVGSETIRLWRELLNKYTWLEPSVLLIVIALGIQLFRHFGIPPFFIIISSIAGAFIFSLFVAVRTVPQIEQKHEGKFPIIITWLAIVFTVLWASLATASVWFAVPVDLRHWIDPAILQIRPEPYPKKSIAILEPVPANSTNGLRRNNPPKSDAPPEEKVRYQMQQWQDWAIAGASPKGINDPIRMLVVKSSAFDANYSTIRAQVNLTNNTIFKLREGIAFLQKDDDPFSRRQVHFYIEKEDKNTNSNQLIFEPQVGERLVLILRIQDADPARIEQKNFDRRMTEYGIHIAVN